MSELLNADGFINNTIVTTWGFNHLALCEFLELRSLLIGLDGLLKGTIGAAVSIKDIKGPHKGSNLRFRFSDLERGPLLVKWGFGTGQFRNCLGLFERKLLGFKMQIGANNFHPFRYKEVD